MRQRLTRDFFLRDTIDVAVDLLGKRLVHVLPDGRRLCGRIVETEAYLGLEDPACHSYGGRRTPRTEVMFGPGGLSYVYFIYGMYFCFNVITGAPGVPEAVLVRALEPLDGLEHDTHGPGRLCRALQISREHNGIDMPSSRMLFLEDDGFEVPAHGIADGPRIGLNEREDASQWPLRFGIAGHPHLSPAKFP